MRILCAALAAAGFLAVPQAFADYSFSFTTKTQQEHAGAASGLSGATSPQSGASGSLGGGGGGGGVLAGPSSANGSALLSTPTVGSHSANGSIRGPAAGDSAEDCLDPASAPSDPSGPKRGCSSSALSAPGAGPGGKVIASYPPPSSGGQGSDSSGVPPTGSQTGGSVLSAGPPPDLDWGQPGTPSLGGLSLLPVDGLLSSSLPGGHGGDTGAGTIVVGDVPFVPVQDGGVPSDYPWTVPVQDGGFPGDYPWNSPPTGTGTTPLLQDPIFSAGPNALTPTILGNAGDLPGPTPSFDVVSADPPSIPEPGTLVLVGLALVVMAALPLRKRR